MPKKELEYLVRSKVKPEVRKVSIKMLLSIPEAEALKRYAEVTGVGESEIVCEAFRRLIKSDKKFKALVDK